jgi:hypothetical protein
MKFFEAYAFRVDKSLADLKRALEAVAPWRWTERDSDIHGDYLSTRAKPDYAMLKVFRDDDEKRWAIDIRYETAAGDDDAEREYEQFRDNLLNVVLPGIGARDVEETDTYG